MTPESTARRGSADAPSVEGGLVRTAVADVDALGGFFTLSLRAAGAADPSWRPVTELLTPTPPVHGTADVLDARIDEVAGQLGGVGRRLAASLLSLSVAARFTSLVLACAVEHRLLVDLPHDRLHWRPWSGGPLPLGIDEPGGRALGEPDDPATADAVAGELAEVHLRPLVAAFRARTSISEQVLWGNATSSLAGALRVLATQRPHALGAATALASAVTSRGPFAGLGSFVAERGHPTGIGFARRTCCLYVHLPGGGMCADCVLRHPPAARVR